MFCPEILLNCMTTFHQLIVNFVSCFFLFLQIGFFLGFNASIVLLSQLRNLLLHVMQMVMLFKSDTAHLSIVELSFLLVFFLKFINLLCLSGLIAKHLNSRKIYLSDIHRMTHFD